MELLRWFWQQIRKTDLGDDEHYPNGFFGVFLQFHFGVDTKSTSGIKRFDNALHIHDKMGTLYCFDFQEDVLRELCGPNVSIQVIDFEAYEANVFHVDTDPSCGNTQET